MALKLRDYQQAAIESVGTECRQGISRQLIALPTGTGKTIIFTALAKALNIKTLILAHREELIKQAKDKFKLHWCDADVGICKAELNELDAKIVIGSVQSCTRDKRLAQLKKQDFRLLIIDEAHHAAAASYKKIIEELGFSDTKNKLLVGFTATPERSDNLGLGDIFEKIVFSRSIATMIKGGFLSPIQGRKILTGISLSGIKTRLGDFAVNELADVINTPERNDFITEKFILHAKERKALFFCANVQHCKDLAESLNEHGIVAKAVWGSMPPEERAQTLADFAKSKIQAITSCAVLTEGYDEPSIECVVMARPTKSRGLYVQAIGRGLRPLPSKKDCLVLDFADKHHNLDSVMDLRKTVPGIQGLKEREQGVAGNSEIPSTDIHERLDESFDILGQTRFSWIALGDDQYSLPDDFNNEIIMTPTDSGYKAKYYTKNSVVDVVVDPLPIDYCSGVAEDFARENMRITYIDLTGTWLKKSRDVPATQKQKAFLKEYGESIQDISKTEASLKIRKIIALIRKQQREWKGNFKPTVNYHKQKTTTLRW